MSQAWPGVVFVDKPAGITSFRAVSAIRKAGEVRKAGHAGTLDKFATGLLIVATGWCTRLIPWLTGLDKRYTATLYLGKETDTLDPEGAVIATGEIPSRKVVEESLEIFKGTIEQVPPEYSAVHTSGTRAHKLARAGKSVRLEPRRIDVFELVLVEFEPPNMTIRVHCSKGTYIRSLARDIGKAAGTRAFVSSLRRTHIGPFSVDDARQLDNIELETDTRSAVTVLDSISGMEVLTVNEDVKEKVRKGMRLAREDLENEVGRGGEAVIVGPGGEMLAIVEKKEAQWSYRLVVPLQ